MYRGRNYSGSSVPRGTHPRFDYFQIRWFIIINELEEPLLRVASSKFCDKPSVVLSLRVSRTIICLQLAGLPICVRMRVAVKFTGPLKALLRNDHRNYFVDDRGCRNGFPG